MSNISIKKGDALNIVETIELSASINQAPLTGVVISQQNITGVIE